MPLDPTLDELSSEQQRSMTHQPEPPNPAAPYLKGASDWATRTFVDPMKTTGFLPGGQNWGRSAVTGMEKFNEGGLTGLAPSLRQYMPGITNTLGDLAQSHAARNVFSTANFGGIPFGGMALRMARIAPGEKRISPTNFGGKDEWSLFSKETGKKLGEMYTNYDQSKNQLKVEYMTGQWPEHFDPKLEEQRSWGIGAHELRTLGPEVLREYPNIDTLKLTRIGGVFKGNPVTLTYKRVDTPEGPVFERIKTQRGMSSRGWVPPAERFMHGRTRARPLIAEPQPLSETTPQTEAERQIWRNAAPEPPPPTEPAPVHGPGWTREREESWDAMRQRQDAEWNALMRRLFRQR